MIKQDSKGIMCGRGHFDSKSFASMSIEDSGVRVWAVSVLRVWSPCLHKDYRGKMKRKSRILRTGQ